MACLKFTTTLICSILFSSFALAAQSIYGSWKTTMYYGSLKVNMKILIQENITYMTNVCEQNGKTVVVSIEVPSKVEGRQYYAMDGVHQEVNEDGIYCAVKSLISPLSFVVTDTSLTFDAALLGKLILQKTN